VSSNTSISLNRSLKANWMIQALRLRSEGVDPVVAAERMTLLLAQDIRGSESIRKSLRYLRRIWIDGHPDLDYLQEQGCKIYLQNPSDTKARILCFFMLLAVYPFAREVAEACGQLFRIQGSVKMEQIKRKIGFRYGDREPVARSTRYAIAAFNDLSMLRTSHSRGIYVVEKQCSLDTSTASFAIQSLFASFGNRQSISRHDLENQPALFAFNASDVVESALSTRNFTLSRESLTREMVTIQVPNPSN
jgi:hypothetical protein